MWSACMWFHVRGSLGSASPDLGENTAVLMGNENSKPSNHKMGHESSRDIGPPQKSGGGGRESSEFDSLPLSLFLPQLLSLSPPPPKVACSEWPWPHSSSFLSESGESFFTMRELGATATRPSRRCLSLLPLFISHGVIFGFLPHGNSRNSAEIAVERLYHYILSFQKKSMHQLCKTKQQDIFLEYRLSETRIKRTTVN